MNVLDLLAIVFVVCALVLIGYKSSKKVKTSSDFLLADRSLSKIQTAFSVAASDFGGSGLVGACAYCYVIGVSGAWWNWCAAPAFLILSIFLVKKLRVLSISTASEYLENRYDTKTRTIATIMQICSVIPMLSAQFLVGAVTINILFGIPQTVGLMISVVLVLLYTMGGGLVAVANTDVFNLIILLLSVFIAVPLLVIEAGGVSNIISTVPDSFLSIGELGWQTPLSWACMSLFMYATQQTYLQRVFAAKDSNTAQFAYIFSSLIYVVYGLMVAIIGIAMSVIVPNISDTNTVYAIMIKTILPVGISGIALGGVFAASLSSADSALLAATSLFVNDIYKKFINNDSSDKKVLWVSRVATLAICIGGVLLAQTMQNVIDMVYMAGLFYSASVFFPIILGVYWKKANAKGAFVSIVISLFVGIISEYVLKGNYEGFLGLPSNIHAALAGVIVLVVISLITNDTRILE